MNRKKIRRMLIKLITGFCIIVSLATSTTKVMASPPQTSIEYRQKNVCMLTGKFNGQYAPHDWFVNRLNTLALAHGKKINILSGYRTIEEQKILFANSNGSGKMVARPGYSRHNVGLAVDVTDDWALKLGNTELAKFGLYKPMDWENWHIEPLETRNRTTAELVRSYGTPTDNIYVELAKLIMKEAAK